MIKISKVARRYGHVLYSLAHEQKNEDKILNDLEALTQLISNNSELSHIFSNSLITQVDTQNIINELSKSLKFTTTMVQFLNILTHHRRLNELKGIEAAYKSELNKKRSEMIANVSSPFKLSDKHLEKLSKILQSKTGHKVEIKTTVDPNLLGGLIIRLGSYMIDASVLTKMNKLKQQLEKVA